MRQQVGQGVRSQEGAGLEVLSGGRGPGSGEGLTLLQQGPQDAGELQEDSGAAAGVHGPVHPAVPVVSVEHVAVWWEEWNQNPEKRGEEAWSAGLRAGLLLGWGPHQAPQPRG